MAADFVFAPTPRLAQGAGRRIFSLRGDKKSLFFVWSSLGQLVPWSLGHAVLDGIACRPGV